MSYLFEKKIALKELKKMPKKNALVSIIVICNNRSLNDIKLSLSSINIQSFENIEVYLIGTNNNSEIKKYISNDKRVKIIKEKVECLLDLKNYLNKNSSYYTIIEAGELFEKTYIETSLLSLELSNGYDATFTDSINYKDKKEYNYYFDNETLKNVSFMVPNLFFSNDIYYFLSNEKILKIRTWETFLKVLKNYRINHQSYYAFLSNKKETVLSEEEYDLFNSILSYSNVTNFPYENYYYGKLKPNFKKELFEKKQNNKTNILMFIPYMIIGGAEKFDLDLIRLINKEKYTITILTDHPNEYILRQDFEKYADCVFEMPSFLERKDWLSFIEYIIYTRNINLIFITNSLFGYSILPYIKTTYPEISVIDYIHSIEFFNRDGGYGRDSKIMTPFIEKTLFCCKRSEEDGFRLLKIPKEKTSTVYIGVDKNKLSFDNNLKDQMRKKYDIEETINIGYICRIDYVKRPLLLVEIMKKSIAENNKIRFIIGGDGPLLKEMEQRVINYNIQDNVIFLGVVTNTKEFYSMCDLTINCSIKEGLALTAYESLAMGIPIVSADVGGQKELINDKVGIIVPLIQKETDVTNFNYSDVEINSYVEAINRIIEKMDYYKNNCRESITEEFDLNYLGKRMEKEIDLIMNHKSNNSISNINILNNYKDLLLEYICYYLMASQYEYQTHINKYNNVIKDVIKQEYIDTITQTPTVENTTQEPIVEIKKAPCKEYQLSIDFLKSIVKIFVFPFRIINVEIKRVFNIFRKKSNTNDETS